MKIVVHLRPGAAEASIEKIDNGQYKVWVTAIPERGKANAAMIKLLADYFHVAPSAIRIIMGKTAREKLVEVAGVDQ